MPSAVRRICYLGASLSIAAAASCGRGPDTHAPKPPTPAIALAESAHVITDREWIDSVGRSWDTLYPLSTTARVAAESAAAHANRRAGPAQAPASVPAPVTTTSYAEATMAGDRGTLVNSGPAPTDPLPIVVLAGAVVLGVGALVGAKAMWG